MISEERLAYLIGVCEKADAHYGSPSKLALMTTTEALEVLREVQSWRAIVRRMMAAHEAQEAERA